MQTAANRTQDLYQPQHVDLLGEQLCRVEAPLLQKVGRMHVEALQSRGIGDHPLRDPTKTPDYQPPAYADYEEGSGSCHEDCDNLRQHCPKAPL